MLWGALLPLLRRCVLRPVLSCIKRGQYLLSHNLTAVQILS